MFFSSAICTFKRCADWFYGKKSALELSIICEWLISLRDARIRVNTPERRARFSCKWTTKATATKTQRFIKQVPSQGKLKSTSLCLQIGLCDRPINVGKLANTNSSPSEAALGDLYFVSWDTKFVHVLFKGVMSRGFCYFGPILCSVH